MSCVRNNAPREKWGLFLSSLTKFGIVASCLVASSCLAQAQSVIVENGRSYRLHTVTKGEGLFRLSQNYGVTQEDIISANPKLKTEGLTEGLTLRIPATSTVQYTVKKGDTAYSIATSHKMSVAKLIEMNPEVASGVREGQTLKVICYTPTTSDKQQAPTSGYASYVAQKGDTTFGIAQRHGISVVKLLELNPSLTSGLKEGDTVRVPSSGTSMYVLHIISEGETLYSIGVKYGVKAQQIIDANVALNPSVLPVGSAIRIPQSSIPAEDGSFIYHRMERGETLYKLCINYNVLQEKITGVNPDVDWNALRVGQVVAIPKPIQHTVVYEDYVVGRRETLYGIAASQNVNVNDLMEANPGLTASGLQRGMTIKIPRIVENPESTPATKNPDYVGEATQQGQWGQEYDYVAEGRPRINVFLLLPFGAYNELKELNASGVNTNRESYNFKSRRYIEFYEGVRLALDSLCEAGANINLKVFDTNNRLDAINQLNTTAVKPDLIIGPAHKEEMADVMKYAREMKVPVVLPFAQCDSTILDNPYVFQASVIDSITGKEIYKHVAEQLPGHNVVLITANTRSPLDKKKAETLKHLLWQKGVKFSEHNYSTSSPTAILPLLQEDKTNVIIIPTNNEARANSVLTSLAGVIEQKPNAKVELWATSEWLSFQTIEVDVFHKLNTRIFTTFAVDESDPKVEYVLNKYRRTYYTEPIAFMPYFQRLKPMSGYSEYGLWGYDIAFNFVGARISLGPDFMRRISSYRPMLLQSNFHFRSLTNWGGAVNIGLKTLIFTPDGSISVKSID